MKTNQGRPRLVVTADGAGVVSHAGSALLGGLAERVGLTGGVDEELAVLGGVRRRGGGHRPGRVLGDLAVMIADGGETIADIAVLGDQPGLHGKVASPATCWRVLKAVADRGQAGLDALARGRARARERAWLARAELTGAAVPPARAAGVDLDYLVIDLDATIVVCHWREGAGDADVGEDVRLPPPARVRRTTPTKPWRGRCAPAAPGATPPRMPVRVGDLRPRGGKHRDVMSPPDRPPLQDPENPATAPGTPARPKVDQARTRSFGRWQHLDHLLLKDRGWDAVEDDDGVPVASSAEVAETYPLRVRMTSPCGAQYNGVYRTDRIQRMYRCKAAKWNAAGEPRCGEPRVQAVVIEARVWSAVVGLLSDPDRFERLAADFVTMQSQEVGIDLSDRGQIDRRLAELTRGIEQTALDHMRAGLAATLVVTAVAELEAERDALLVRRADLDHREQTAAQDAQRLGDLKLLAATATERLAEMSLEELAECCGCSTSGFRCWTRPSPRSCA